MKQTRLSFCVATAHLVSVTSEEVICHAGLCQTQNRNKIQDEPTGSTSHMHKSQNWSNFSAALLDTAGATCAKLNNISQTEVGSQCFRHRGHVYGQDKWSGCLYAVLGSSEPETRGHCWVATRLGSKAQHDSDTQLVRFGPCEAAQVCELAAHLGTVVYCTIRRA